MFYVVDFQDPEKMLSQMIEQIADRQGWDLDGQEGTDGDTVVEASTTLVFNNEADRDACIKQLNQFTVNFTQEWRPD